MSKEPDPLDELYLRKISRYNGGAEWREGVLAAVRALRDRVASLEESVPRDIEATGSLWKDLEERVAANLDALGSLLLRVENLEAAAKPSAIPSSPTVGPSPEKVAKAIVVEWCGEQQDNLQAAIATAIREAEAAAEQRGRDAAKEAVDHYLGVAAEMTRQSDALRDMLWLRHGCPVSSLYGDDGEKQCSACGIDFKEWHPDTIRERFTRLAALCQAPAAAGGTQAGSPGPTPEAMVAAQELAHEHGFDIEGGPEAVEAIAIVLTDFAAKAIAADRASRPAATPATTAGADEIVEACATEVAGLAVGEIASRSVRRLLGRFIRITSVFWVPVPRISDSATGRDEPHGEGRRGRRRPAPAAPAVVTADALLEEAVAKCNGLCREMEVEIAHIRSIAGDAASTAIPEAKWQAASMLAERIRALKGTAALAAPLPGQGVGGGDVLANDLIETAWGIIANAGGGDWSKETRDWQVAAERWRDEWHAHLKRIPRLTPVPGEGVGKEPESAETHPRHLWTGPVVNDSRTCQRCAASWLQGGEPGGPCRPRPARRPAAPAVVTADVLIEECAQAAEAESQRFDEAKKAVVAAAWPLLEQKEQGAQQAADAVRRLKGTRALAAPLPGQGVGGADETALWHQAAATLCPCNDPTEDHSASCMRMRRILDKLRADIASLPRPAMEVTDETVEAGAVAIHDADDDSVYAWGGLKENEREEYRARARACLRAALGEK